MGWNHIAVIGVVVIALTLASPVGADSVVTIDQDHGLTKSSKISEFEKSGVASARVVVPELTITISETTEGLDQEGLPGSDIANVYVQFEYQEDIPRTIRVFIPKQYFYPVTKSGLESTDGKITADMVPTNGSKHTAITVRFTGKTTATFKISKEASITFGHINSTKSKADKLFGISVPNILGGKQWKYIEQDQFTNGSETYAIDYPEKKRLVIQYDRDYSVGVEEWHPVPDCSRASESTPVCQYSKIGEDGTQYVLLKSTQAPAIRYKTGGGLFTGLGGNINDISSVPGRFLQDLLGTFGG